MHPAVSYVYLWPSKKKVTKNVLEYKVIDFRVYMYIYLNNFICNENILPAKTLIPPWITFGFMLCKASMSKVNNSGQASGQSNEAILDIAYA